MQTPDERFSAFMRKIIQTRLLPAYASESQTRLNLSDHASSTHIAVQESNLIKGHSVKIGARGILTTYPTGKESLLEWQKAHFVIPFSSDELVDEFVHSSKNYDSYYSRVFASAERNEATRNLSGRHTLGCFAWLFAFLAFIAYQASGVGVFLDHWFITGVFLYVVVVHMIPSSERKFAEENADKIDRETARILNERYPGFQNYVSIESIKFEAYLALDMMDARLFKEIVAYGCKAMDKKLSIEPE